MEATDTSSSFSSSCKLLYGASDMNVAGGGLGRWDRVGYQLAHICIELMVVHPISIKSSERCRLCKVVCANNRKPTLNAR